MFKKLDFEYSGYVGGSNYKVILTTDKDGIITAEYKQGEGYYNEKQPLKRTLTKDETEKVCKLIEECALSTWNRSYRPEAEFILDGYFWNVFLDDSHIENGFGNNYTIVHGENAYPWCFYKLIRAIIVAVPEFSEGLEHFAEEKTPVYRIEPLSELEVKI